MKYIPTFIITVAFLSFFSFVKGQTFLAPEQKASYVVDGKANNWPDLIFASDSSYAYFFTHQDNQLLVSLKVFDLKLQNHILLTGMTLWFDEKGKKKQKKGIHYPTGYKQQEILRDPMRFREVLEAVQAQKTEIAEKLVSLELVNFKGKGTRAWGKAMNPNTFMFKLDFDEFGTLVYEGSVPLDLIFTDPSIYTGENSKGFSIGWATGELGRPELRGDDAVGLSGSNPANPAKFNSEWDRKFQKELNFYRSYAVSEKFWIKRMKLE